jgi:hypothetical protein
MNLLGFLHHIFSKINNNNSLFLSEKLQASGNRGNPGWKIQRNFSELYNFAEGFGGTRLHDWGDRFGLPNYDHIPEDIGSWFAVLLVSLLWVWLIGREFESRWKLLLNRLFRFFFFNKLVKFFFKTFNGPSVPRIQQPIKAHPSVPF